MMMWENVQRCVFKTSLCVNRTHTPHTTNSSFAETYINKMPYLCHFYYECMTAV